MPARKPASKILSFSVIGIVLDDHEGFLCHVDAANGKEAAKKTMKALEERGYDEFDIAAVIPGFVTTDAAVLVDVFRA
jgi:hypothetical protein